MPVTKQDIITAIKNCDTFLKIPELQGVKPRLNKNGSPFAFVGGFNMVFQLEQSSKKWAFRVWHIPPKGEYKERYRKISKYLSAKKLSYFADFIYDEKGILVNGNLLDTIRMEWLEGKLLKEYIEENLRKKKRLVKLADNFLEMCMVLRDNKISHGDLQEGNILINNDGSIRLIDYDSICIPEIEGQQELVTGLKGYQHPSRFKAGKASLKADYFSELIIYLSILAISEDNKLWATYQVKDTQYLLFTETDFENFENSNIYRDLQKLSSKIKSLTRLLCLYLSTSSYLDLTALESFLTPPSIEKFRTNKIRILKGTSIELSWKVSNVDSLFLNNNLGVVTAKDTLFIQPRKSATYKLTAENAFGKSEQEVTVTVLPQPVISEFRAKKQKIEYGKETQLIWSINNVERVELYHNGTLETVMQKGEKTISPKSDSSYKIVGIALDGKTTIEQEITVQVFKKVEITSFTSNLNFVIETLPFTLRWQTKNASTLILSSNIQADIDVTGKNEIELIAKKNAFFWLQAKNEMFAETSQQIKVEVQAIPVFNPSLLPRVPGGEDLVPSFDLNFKDLADTILTESQLNFQSAMETPKKFRLMESLHKILKR